MGPENEYASLVESLRAQGVSESEINKGLAQISRDGGLWNPDTRSWEMRTRNRFFGRSIYGEPSVWVPFGDIDGDE